MRTIIYELIHEYLFLLVLELQLPILLQQDGTFAHWSYDFRDFLDRHEICLCRDIIVITNEVVGL